MLLTAKSRVAPYSGGLLLASVIAVAATFLSDHYGAPVMLFALLLGMAFHFLSEDNSCAVGVDFAAKALLRFGVGLLGLRLGLAEVMSLGLTPVIAIIGFVLVTFGCGVVMARIFGRRTAFGMLAGGSVAICGASAALAITSVLPLHKDREQDTLFVVIGVTALSTIAMIAYPILFKSLGLSDIESGFLVGATIHDVAQVVGAGYSISDEAGDFCHLRQNLACRAAPGGDAGRDVQLQRCAAAGRRRSVVSADVRSLRGCSECRCAACCNPRTAERAVPLVFGDCNCGLGGKDQPCQHGEGEAEL